MYVNYEVFEEMQKTHDKSINAINKMIELVDKTLSFEKPANRISLITSFMLSKYSKTLMSIRILSVFGFEEDTRSLLRILLEEMFNLLYISIDPENRINQFVDFNKIERKKFLDKIKNNYNEAFDNLDEKKKNVIMSDFQLVKSDYPRNNSWSGKSMKEIATEIGGVADFWYDVIYSAESIYVHSSINSSKNFIFEQDDTVNIKVGPYPFIATDIYSKAIELTRNMLKQSLVNWNMDVSEVFSVWDECKRLLTEEFLSHKPN